MHMSTVQNDKMLSTVTFSLRFCTLFFICKDPNSSCITWNDDARVSSFIFKQSISSSFTLNIEKFTINKNSVDYFYNREKKTTMQEKNRKILLLCYLMVIEIFKFLSSHSHEITTMQECLPHKEENLFFAEIC